MKSLTKNHINRLIPPITMIITSQLIIDITMDIQHTEFTGGLIHQDCMIHTIITTLTITTLTAIKKIHIIRTMTMITEEQDIITISF